MKKIIYIVMISIMVLSSCTNSLDLYPLSQPTSESWYTNEVEIQLALNDQYRPNWWTNDEGLERGSDYISDDVFYRTAVSAVKAGTVNSQWVPSVNLWTSCYTAIARANRTLVALNSPETQKKVSKSILDIYIGEARFFRAQQYARLVTHFGDVVYSDAVITLDEAYKIGRTDKAVVLQKIYEDFDAAAIVLPKSYPTSVAKRVTKGAAYAMKARAAIYMNDFSTAAIAAKACIDLGEYTLNSDYSTLFLQSTKNANEVIFGLPTARSPQIVGNMWTASDMTTRNSGGFAAVCPTWDLFCSYLCTDGLTIDKSPLYDPHLPWKNRDPRCKATIVEIGTEHLGYIYDPNPYTRKVLKTATGTLVNNNDQRLTGDGAGSINASFNGLVWKKAIDASWITPSTNENDQIIIRYADVLLMYAEAKNELGLLTQGVLDSTVNLVRARAYKVAVTATTLYPAVTMSNPNLRTIIRTERRMEFANEGLRYMDIIRWRLANKVLTKPIFGMLEPAALKTKVIDPGLWFFPGTPTIDADGIPDFSALEAAGLIRRIVSCSWNDRQYLWPIPTTEIQINSNIKQNPGY